MKKYQHIYSTDWGNPEASRRISRDLKMVLWINVVGLLSLISFGVYIYEINEFGNNVASFVLRHANFFGPVVIAFVIFLIYKKARP